MYDKIKQLTGSRSASGACETLVGIGSHMKGEITCKGPSRIAGHVEGDLIGDDKLIISEEAVVTGKVSGKDIEIDGKVSGTITATDRIILRETARIEGDLYCPSVIIEEGAVFNGTSHMPATADNNQSGENVHKISSVAKQDGSQVTA